MNSSQGQQSVINTFTSTLNTVLNTDGSADEKGLQQTHAALTSNSSFMRNPSNGLSVIVVSDEDDSGSNMQGQNFINWFQGLETQRPIFGSIQWILWMQMVDFSAEIQNMKKLFKQPKATLLISTPIHISNRWKKWHLAAAGLTVRFPLDQEPANLSSITVIIEGSEVAQDPFNGWTYDSRSNSIVFHGTEIPEALEKA